MRQLLQLHPHIHTGKVLSHKHTSYHALFLILGLAGLFMMFLGSVARAADYVVTATVPATIPSGTPVITSPADGTQTADPSVTIAGTCPVATPPVIMTIHDEVGFLGSGQCGGGGSFAVPVNLSLGTHHITATVTTITNGTGQTSQPVAITYILPIVPTTPATPASPNKPSTPAPSSSPVASDPLRITSDTEFLIFGYNTDAVWRGSFAGGTAPYSVTIEWGDGTRESYIDRRAGEQSFSHHYNRLKPYRVTIRISDSAGHTTVSTIAAISPATFNQPPTSIGNVTATGSSIGRTLYLLYLAQLMFTILLWEYEKFGRLLFVRVRAQKR